MCEVGLDSSSGIGSMSSVRREQVIHETESEMGLDIDGDGIVGPVSSELESERRTATGEEEETRTFLPSDAAAIPIFDGDEAAQDWETSEDHEHHHALLRLNTHENLISWLKIRSYLRDVKGLRTLELLRTCTLVFLPPLGEWYTYVYCTVTFISCDSVLTT